jgi:hypothetical protein
MTVTEDPLATPGALTETVDVAAEMGPTVTAIVGAVVVTAFPLIVAPSVRGVPAWAPVNVAEYCPLP